MGQSHSTSESGTKNNHSGLHWFKTDEVLKCADVWRVIYHHSDWSNIFKNHPEKTIVNILKYYTNLGMRVVLRMTCKTLFSISENTSVRWRILSVNSTYDATLRYLQRMVTREEGAFEDEVASKVVLVVFLVDQREIDPVITQLCSKLLEEIPSYYTLKLLFCIIETYHLLKEGVDERTGRRPLVETNTDGCTYRLSPLTNEETILSFQRTRGVKGFSVLMQSNVRSAEGNFAVLRKLLRLDNVQQRFVWWKGKIGHINLKIESGTNHMCIIKCICVE